MRPDAYYLSESSEQPAGSLFSGGAATLSDDAIQRILAYKYSPPELSRVAIMPFGREIWSSWSEELAFASEKMQADLLLVYRSYCQSFERYRIFGTDKSRAYCGVEVVPLDTRTGLVPFTTVATRSYDVTENQSDANFHETRLKAQLDATAAALSDVSTEIVQFLAEAN